MNKQRLLKVVRALRESKAPKDFSMGRFGSSCGTPACALGHYASRRDLQRTFELKFFAWPEGVFDDEMFAREELVTSCDGQEIGHDEDPVLQHFDLTRDQAEELFGAAGCGNAKSTKGAARYIERFVKRNEAR